MVTSHAARNLLRSCVEDLPPTQYAQIERALRVSEGKNTTLLMIAQTRVALMSVKLPSGHRSLMQLTEEALEKRFRALTAAERRAISFGLEARAHLV